MNKELRNIVKKSAKIGGVVCVAAGAIAIMTSKTALQVILEGGKYFKDTVKKIIDDDPKVENAPNEPVEMTDEEAVAEAEDFAESASPNASADDEG